MTLMAIRKIPFVLDEFYHVYNRGNSKQTIFHDKSDYQRFINLVFLSNGKSSFKIDFIKDIYKFNRGAQLVNVGAYCLMPNHFHILLQQADEIGTSKFIQKLSTGYSMYYNKKYKRTGTLFEGKFKSQHVKDDRHLKYLFSYIHLNPVKIVDSKWRERKLKNNNKVLNFLDSYSFSSYIDYLQDGRPQATILNKRAFPNYFSNKKVFKDEIFDWLNLPTNRPCL